MRLHAYLVQALLPGNENLRFAQLPGIQLDEVSLLPPSTRELEDVVGALEKNEDERLSEVRKAVRTWGRIELVDASFKGLSEASSFLFTLNQIYPVIGERLVTPSAIVYLVVKLRLNPPTSSSTIVHKEPDADETKRLLKINDEKDHQFLISRKDAEDMPSIDSAGGWAHAPYWPGVSCLMSCLVHLLHFSTEP
jgi:translocation protein SEC63